MLGPGTSANELTSGDHKTRQENSAKVASRRSKAKAERMLGGTVEDGQEDWLLPQRRIDVDPDDPQFRHIGDIIAGVEGFKLLRGGAVAVCSLVTSVEHAHTLVDVGSISRSKVTVVKVYEVERRHIFETYGDILGRHPEPRDNGDDT